MNAIKNIFEFLIYMACILGLAFTVGYLTNKFPAYDEAIRVVIVAVIIGIALLISYIRSRD